MDAAHSQAWASATSLLGLGSPQSRDEVYMNGVTTHRQLRLWNASGRVLIGGWK